MNKVSLTVLVSLSVLAGAAYAQEGGVTVSTDPAKSAEVEQRAQALQQQQEQQPEEEMPAHKTMHHEKGMRHHHKAAPKSE
ncbi:hypothetical protein B0G57_101241 [Trinickia symbiotica]|uniref:Uncharacterized protein n=1 Tax=Trinickia symbiotica TaxID=863227 RepID=A0A2N7X8I3_9BURK|nr:hypothetical protein [Trinickia symbiotica]PMS38063.1 hypothetical protein C0Z20_04485 [Trinickia symbiotica]PPK47276.1 hypothetical protein B0G57_101241 [Trinickia symbiotica]